jgi:hypothetical protein
MISVVIPTVTGREELLEQTIAAFRATDAHLEFVIVRNHSTCGDAWNHGAEQATGTYLLLGGDDLIPDPVALDVAVTAAEEDVYPAPCIVRPDGTVESCGTLGQGLYLTPGRDGIPCYNASVPFMLRNLWGVIGPSLPIHYHADDFLAYRARFDAGLSVETRQRYRFTHLDGQIGKPRNIGLGETHRWIYADAVSQSRPREETR